MEMKNELNQWYVASVMSPIQQSDPVSGHIYPYTGWTDCIDWCQERFGSATAWHYVGEGIFEFKNKQDHLFFVLRWA